MSKKRKGKSIPFPLVTIDWLDAWGHSGWKLAKDFKGMVGAPCSSTGYLIEENKNAYILACTVALMHDDEWDSNTVMCIPKSMARRVRSR